VLYGRSSHHKLEAVFKCFARAMKYACSKDARLKDQLPSTKGCRSTRIRSNLP
jgi:imidazoleglycerol-phosphate dehydratase